ncbi:MAG: 4Fe-4S dicluster domain-containing protein [Chloroflexi bacterium]|nr:4Fe-4S dicluster domain-containing protein [Chloroflexota bacterium]
MPIAPDVSQAQRRGTSIFQPLEIAVDRCKGCELCIGVCPKHVLENDLTVVNKLGHHPIRLTDAEACTSCALCARICPDAVFTIYARPRPVHP